jgi:RNA polymerase sigma-70 factor, ECF subfamily
VTSVGAARERLYLDLVARYQSAILNYVYRLVGDADQAEDLTQETFLKAFRALDQLESGADADVRRRAWLYRIAHNTATDYLRRRARLSWLSLDAARGRGGGDPAPPLVAREPVQRALAALPAEHRAILHLFAQDGLSAAEVAAVLGISEAAARKRRQRAREAFESAYHAAGGEP